MTPIINDTITFTRSELEEILEKSLEKIFDRKLQNVAMKSDLVNFVTKEDLARIENNLQRQINATQSYLEEQMAEVVEEKTKNYRDDILTRLDDVMNQLEKTREDYLFVHHDIYKLEKRIKKLEQS